MENHRKVFFNYNILYKKIMDARPLRIRFNKVDRVIKIYDGTKYLELFDSYNAIYDLVN